MLDKTGFNDWAAEYDAAVDASEAAGTYPFCGYAAVHEAVFGLVRNKNSVLDLGIGTARLTKRLYDEGLEVCGVDFSENMLAVAREKMPDAKLICADLSSGMPRELDGKRFGAITALYSIHHLTDAQKAKVIDAGLDMLAPGGAFIIGDVAFEDAAALAACKAEAGEAFDDDEHYCVAEELCKLVKGALNFKRISFCAGVIIISRTDNA